MYLCGKLCTAFYSYESPRHFFPYTLSFSSLYSDYFLNFYEKYNISKSNISEKHEKRKYKTWDLHTYYFNEEILQMSKMLHCDENCMWEPIYAVI